MTHIRTEPLTSGGNRFRYVMVNHTCKGLIQIPGTTNDTWILRLDEGKHGIGIYTYDSLVDLAEALRDKFPATAE